MSPAEAVGAGVAAEELQARDWVELQEMLFQDAWDPELRRYRSPYAFRGQATIGRGLVTSLTRLGGEYGELEPHLLRNFRKYAHRDAVVADTAWHWLSLAQHHGLPTRLLDWTFSPFVALHFVTSSLQHMDEDGAVWAVDYKGVHRHVPDPLRAVLVGEGSAVFTADMLQQVAGSLEEFDRLAAEPFLVFFEPPAVDARIVNQYALFSVYSDAFATPQEWLDRHPELWRRIVVPAELKWEVRDKLDQANITERTLFPGLDGLSRWLERNYSARDGIGKERKER